jgi:hypothetical protein
MSKHKQLIRDLDSGCNDGQGDLPSVLWNAARALEAANKKEAALKAKLAAANHALDAIAARCDTHAFDNPSSALESIGDTLVSTGRNVWADVE